MRCVNKLRKGKDYIECFRDVAAKDQGDGFEVEKCATCSCKQLERMNIDVGKYPELDKMFCYLGNKYIPVERKYYIHMLMNVRKIDS